MDEAQVERLLGLIGCYNLKRRGTWINASCPFAAQRHRKGSDRTPSFGISIAPDSVSHFQCFSCGINGDLAPLVWGLGRRRGYGRWYEQAAKLVMQESPSLYEIERRIALIEGRELPKVTARLKKIPTTTWGSASVSGGRAALSLDSLSYPILPEKRARQLDPLPDRARDYLTGPRRHLNATTLALWGVGWLSYQKRVALPIRDWNGKLVGITGRCLDREVDGCWQPEQKPKFLHSKGFNKAYFLFGEHLVERGLPGILLEGHFDAMYLRQMGYPNAVAVMGSALNQVQVEKVVTMFSEVTIFPDGDEPGRLAATRWEHALKGRKKVRVLSPEDGNDPDDHDADELADLFLDNPMSML